MIVKLYYLLDYDTCLIVLVDSFDLGDCPPHLHYYRMDLLSRTVTAFSPDYRAGTTIPRLKVPPLVPGHRAGTKEGPLVPVGVTNRD